MSSFGKVTNDKVFMIVEHQKFIKLMLSGLEDFLLLIGTLGYKLRLYLFTLF